MGVDNGVGDVPFVALVDSIGFIEGSQGMVGGSGCGLRRGENVVAAVYFIPRDFSGPDEELVGAVQEAMSPLGLSIEKFGDLEVVYISPLAHAVPTGATVSLNVVVSASDVSGGGRLLHVDE